MPTTDRSGLRIWYTAEPNPNPNPNPKLPSPSPSPDYPEPKPEPKPTKVLATTAAAAAHAQYQRAHARHPLTPTLTLTPTLPLTLILILILTLILTALILTLILILTLTSTQVLMPDIPAREVADNCVACRVMRDGTAYGWRNHAHGLGRDIWSDHFAADGQARYTHYGYTHYDHFGAHRHQLGAPNSPPAPCLPLAPLATTPRGTLCRRASRSVSSRRSTRRSSADSPSRSICARGTCCSCTASTITRPATGRRATAVTRQARCVTSTCSRTCSCRPAGQREAPSWRPRALSWRRCSLAAPASGDAKTRGSGLLVGLWAAPPRPGSAFQAPWGPRGNTIGLGAKSADPAASDHEQADALRPGRAAAQPHVRGLAARGGRRPRHRPAAPPGRKANHVAANSVIELF